MTRHRRLPSPRYLKGFSLIELMVSMAISLIIAAAAFSAYLGAAGASKIAEAQGRMNEDAQAALTILTQQLRMAGGNPNQPGRTDKSRRNPVYTPYDPATFTILPVTFALSSFSIRGCDGTFSNIATATGLDDLNCAAGAGALPDSIVVSYEADAFNSVSTTAKVPTDCLGVGLEQATATFPLELPSGPYSYYVANNLFYIGTSGSIVSPSLYCKGNGVASTALPLVENIEDMQFTYGAVKSSTAATDVTTAVVAGYLTADQVLTQINMAGLASDAERWAKVITVRICVLVRSEVPVAPDSASARYLKCDGTLETTPPDLRLRRAYQATVVLRNRRFLP
ncbi:type IV pilus assembly protein PilW [soil metagenome]